jgi:uncharacterized membrane protein YedE/YeeE
MKNIPYVLIGVVFGIALTKGEAISWFRMQEMFHFESFHMYGIFMTAVPIAALSIIMIKKLKVPAANGQAIDIPKKPYHHGIILGGLTFGFGWALTGACPGPLYAQVGAGYSVTLVTFFSAVLGTWVYARLQPYLPD